MPCSRTPALAFRLGLHVLATALLATALSGGLPAAAQSIGAEPPAAQPPRIIDDLPAPEIARLDASTRDLVERGRYVARLGDCVACHTGHADRPLAGGLALNTPFGTLYSTNITPDPGTGIGRYSFPDFEQAMRHGVDAQGRHLYPAMPYPSYARLSDEDMRALYAYLMQGVAAITLPNQAADMAFPFNLRWGLGLWNFLFLDSKPFRADPTRSPEWNRGAYLVQGPGHCGACHTPRGIAFQEETPSDAGSHGLSFLAGETVEHWRALSLRELWTPSDTAEMLRTGHNRYGTVSGNMVDVVQHSTQYFSDGDLMAIGIYLKSLPAGRQDKPMRVPQGPAPRIRPPTAAEPAADLVPLRLFNSRGGLAYLQFCSDCHRIDGAGVQGVFPPLAGNPSLQSETPEQLIHLLLTGWRAPRTLAAPRSSVMPAFSSLSDQELAEIVQFVRASWGRATDHPVGGDDIRRLRRQLNAGTGGNSPFETPRLADMLGQANARQLVLGARLNLQTGQLLPGQVGNSLQCTSCHLNAGTIAHGSPYVGVSAAFPAYAPRAGRVISLEDRINGCFLRSMNGKPLPVDSVEMQAMVAYFDWMKRETRPEAPVPGRGLGPIDTHLHPDPANGRRIYEAQCALCHGGQGQGLHDAEGRTIYPPLWGPQSFNIGAGMARTFVAAAFVRRNMPIAFQAQFPLGQGGLSEQEAVDVAEYFTHRPRPDFAGKVRDWPRDRKPTDARY